MIMGMQRHAMHSVLSGDGYAPGYAPGEPGEASPDIAASAASVLRRSNIKG